MDTAVAFGDEKIGARLRNLRLRSNISLRQLAKRAQVSIGYVSSIERDLASPTLAILRRLLLALDTDLNDFFSNGHKEVEGWCFRKNGMQSFADTDREYTFVLPKREDIAVEMTDENYFHGDTLPEFEVMAKDFAGYVVAGEMLVEIEGEEPVVLNSGDAFHVSRGVRMRGYCPSGTMARLMTVAYLRNKDVCDLAESD